MPTKLLLSRYLPYLQRQSRKETAVILTDDQLPFYELRGQIKAKERLLSAHKVYECSAHCPAGRIQVLRMADVTQQASTHFP